VDGTGVKIQVRKVERFESDMRRFVGLKATRCEGSTVCVKVGGANVGLDEVFLRYSYNVKAGRLKVCLEVWRRGFRRVEIRRVKVRHV